MRRITNTEITDIGNYAIIRQIAEGAFGKVFLAQHKLLRCKVVIKKGDRSVEAGGDDNLMREFYYLREFDHPNITKLYEIILTETRVYMVLQYYSEGDLFDYLARRGRLPLDEASRLFSQILGSVHYIHLSGCCHRDLKLENVILDKRLDAKLSDFGFAREMPYSANGKGLLNTFCGTPAYMAPELVARQPYSGVKVDIWALGVMLYVMLQGYMPFGDDPDLPTLAQQPKFGDHVPEEVAALLRSMLAYRPEERPATLADVLVLPFLQPWGAVQLATTREYAEGKHRMTPSEIALERYAFKRISSFGIDKELLRKNLASGEMDSLVGFWELFKEKERKRHRHARKLKTRSRSMLRLNSTRSIMDSRSVKSKPETQSPLTSPRLPATPTATPIPPTPATPATPVYHQKSLSVSKTIDVGNGYTANSDRRSSVWTTESKSRKPLLQKLKTWMGKVKSIGGSPSLSSSTSSSKQSLNLSNDEARSTLVNSEASGNHFDGTPEKALKFVVGDPADEDDDTVSRLSSMATPKDSSTPFFHKRGSSGRPARPVSMVSSYSVQSQVSETSVGSGYNTGYSTDTPGTQRPAYTRARSSEYSLNSRSGMTSIGLALGTESPGSSTTQLSRSNSTDSGAPGPRGREKRRSKSKDSTKKGKSLIFKRGKSPLGFSQSPASSTWYLKNRKANPLVFNEHHGSDVIEEEASDDIPFPKTTEAPHPRYQNILGEINEDVNGSEYEDVDDEEDEVEEILVSKLKHLSV
ncbi:unnamed protein product [Kuraishia capsulata CBS 1993]|uniref:non-specific serine/threonine protein kinase n=1 Tax=Kuraishia capsulata CBS 1993 TaxID=1382522 RepID=W6MFR7_9ASCO|nr:uncharacterized protein KUCA_T00000705001 [Kuraishia capsulata CBS 1993]CDK24739.1 unnamed protein product [Kuraishia capsulata CBS 1993]